MAFEERDEFHDFDKLLSHLLDPQEQDHRHGVEE